MIIAIIITLGITIISVLGIITDYSIKKASGKQQSSLGMNKRLEELEKKVEILMSALSESDEKISSLTTEMKFLNRLLSDETKSPKK